MYDSWPRRRHPPKSRCDSGDVLPRFAFIVHALSPLHRVVMGLRGARPGLALGWRDGTAPWDIVPLCHLRLGDQVEGVVMGIPMTPADLLADQERAVARMARAVALAEIQGPVDAVGLGSLCAVVAGRGDAVAEIVGPPVTRGAAATAWALVENTLAVWRARGGVGRVGIVGSNGAVGRAVAAILAAHGVAVQVDSARAGKGLDVAVCVGPEEVVKGTDLVVGAGPTGGVLPAMAVAPGTVVVDVALPGTLVGPLPSGVLVLAGEAVALPAEWRRGFWGTFYQLLAGYGPSQVFACLVEPLVLALAERSEPYSLGRRVSPQDVEAFGLAASALGFRPRLAQGWRGVDLATLGTGG